MSDGGRVKPADRNSGQSKILTSGQSVGKKDGYVYVYTSNESQQDVLFDYVDVSKWDGAHFFPSP